MQNYVSWGTNQFIFSNTIHPLSLPSETQVVEPSEGASSAFAAVARSPPRVVQPRWLNIVFDLNGILCACEEFRLRSSGLRFNPDSAPHSSTVPARVGPKLVWVRPSCFAFLHAVSEFATISIWSSMRLGTTKAITQYLFRDMAPPKIILGQEHCARIATSVSAMGPKYLMVKGTQKEIFLKTLAVGLFPINPELMSKDNTIIVDDSAYKHVLNDPENVLLSDTWSYRGDGPKDTSLLDVLLPWLQRLHNSADLGLRSFRKEDPLGRPTLGSDPNNLEFIELTNAIAVSDGLIY